MAPRSCRRERSTRRWCSRPFATRGPGRRRATPRSWSTGSKSRKRDLEEALATWAPILIADPSLAQIGASATEVLQQTIRVHTALLLGSPATGKGLGDSWDLFGLATAQLIPGLQAHEGARARLEALIADYRQSGLA